jgi:hypothetical protein
MIERVGIPVTRHLEPDTWHRIDAEGRGPKARHRTQSRVPGTWDLIPGTGANPTPKAGYRAPGTEPGDREPDTRYLILHWVAGTRYRILGENDP